MIPVLLHLYGPFAIQSYGTMIVLGALATLFFIKRDKPLMKIMSFEQVLSLATVIIVAAVFGGRTLFLLENHPDSFAQAFSLWTGGFSILGSVIANCVAVPFYLRSQNLPVVKVFDRVCIYIPLLQAIARLGCFMAGCCHGQVKDYFFSVTYTHPESFAPLGQPLVPVQLIASLCLFSFFLILYRQKDDTNRQSGFFTGRYLQFFGIQRYFLDFARADHVAVLFNLSHTQIIALILWVVGILTTGRAINKEEQAKKKKVNLEDLKGYQKKPASRPHLRTGS